MKPIFLFIREEPIFYIRGIPDGLQFPSELPKCGRKAGLSSDKPRPAKSKTRLLAKVLLMKTGTMRQCLSKALTRRRVQKKGTLIIKEIPDPGLIVGHQPNRPR
jgi:hypothetical protein